MQLIKHSNKERKLFRSDYCQVC